MRMRFMLVGGAVLISVTSLALVVSFVSLVLLASVEAIQIVSIDSYGAVANDSSVDAAVKNSHAIANALMKAANGDAVLVPRYSHYYTFSSIVSDIADNVQMWIEGELIAHSNITAWPYNGNDYQHILQIQNWKEYRRH